MGRRQFSSKLFYQLSLDRLVPETHLLRRISEAVDFSFVRPLCAPYYSHTGQPSVDPVVLFRMLLVGYLYGITSERRLTEEIGLHLAYRWFVGYDFDEAIPDHSVLSKARARFGPEVFEEFFRRSIELCREAGLLGEGPVYVDTSLVEAAASVDSLVPREEPSPPLSVSEYVNRLYRENETPDAPEPEDEGQDQTGPPRPPSAGGGGTGQGSRRKRRAKRGGPPRHPPNQTQQSRTDPEATLVNRPAFGRHLAYKAHIAVAGTRGQVITAIVATTGAAADEHHLANVLWQHQRLSRLGIAEVVTDAKYGTAPNYEYLDLAGAIAFIPTTRLNNPHTGIWSRDHFQWLPDEDAYLCPAGERLECAGLDKRYHRIRYQAPKGSCLTCSFRSQCTPSGGRRSLHRQVVQDLIDQAQERAASPLGKRRSEERKIYAEGTFALAKELHGLRRTRFRGTSRVQIQFWLTAAAMNIKKAVRTTVMRGAPGAAVASITNLCIALTRPPIMAFPTPSR